MVDQFLKDQVNNRIDVYGGTLENQCRFAFEIVESKSNEIGANGLWIRLFPLVTLMELKDVDHDALGLYMAIALK